jgi:hypothetical protein
VLLDTLGVTVLGARQEAQRRIVTAWDPEPGRAPLIGAGRTTTVEAAAWLNATALVRLEFDEGHKQAKGHPAAHGVPAVLALAAHRDAPGPDLMAALVVAYEVAARFGRATRLRPRMHPHGSWGVAGAAAGCARLLGLDAGATAAAIDAGSGMPIAGHFGSALDGNPVRDAWMAASNVAGLASARLAAAGEARATGTAAGSLGELLGELDPAELAAGDRRTYAGTGRPPTACSTRRRQRAPPDSGARARPGRRTTAGPDSLGARWRQTGTRSTCCGVAETPRAQLRPRARRPARAAT